MNRKPTNKTERSRRRPKGARETNAADRSKVRARADRTDSAASAADSGRSPTPLCPIVGIGASAGGIEALLRLFEAMPSDSGMAFLIVMHLDPTRESGLTHVLGQHSSMTVAEAADGMAIEPDHIYVIAPNSTLTVDDGLLRMTEPTERRGVRYPADRLFESLATHRRERAICIVLSGTGSDGTEGLKEVKAQGGCILVQDPSTARFDGMPRSAIAAKVADHVIAPEQMPDVLMRYTRHAYIAGSEVVDETTNDPSIDPVLALLRSRAGQDFRLYKRGTLTRRIHRRMGLNNLHTLAEYVELLRTRPAELETLIKDLMINVTGFFRDPEAWTALDEAVLAPLVDERDSGAAVRLWIPACATGEEAYSLAMLLVDRAEAANKQFDIKLFATDGRDDNLNAARAGVYSDGAVAKIPPRRLHRYFDKLDGTYQVNKEIRDLVVFASHNLLRDPPFSQIDLISCRNLLIYLDPVAQKRAVALMHFALRQGGHMFLGNAEGISGQDDLFETVSEKWRIYRRVGPTRRDITDFQLLPGRRRPNQSQEPAVPDSGQPPQRLVDVAKRALLERFAPASVLIERDSRVLWFHGSTGDYLEPPPGEPSRDLLAMARSGLRVKLRDAVRRAASEKRSVGFHARVRQGNRDQAVAVTVAPLVATHGPDNLLLVSFRNEDVSQAPSTPSDGGDDDGHIDEGMQFAFEEELSTTRAELQETIEQFERTNEELTAAHEEVTSMNEELQSTNEELETSKEELQSFNEELQTVNSQLQYKNQELEETTDTLNNLLASSEIATVFLDKNFCIRWFSPSSKELLELVESDIGRPVTHFAWKVADDALLRDAETVLQKLNGIDAEVRSSADRWYLRRLLPYRTHNDRIAGVVISFIDITERKLALDGINSARLYAEAIIETVRHPVMVLDGELRVQSVNPAFCEAFACPAEESHGYLLHELDHGAWDIPELRRLLREVMSEARAFENFAIEHDFPRRGRRHMLLNARKLARGYDRPELILLAIEDVTAHVESDAIRETLIGELSHRVKNMLAMVLSIGSQTVRQSSSLGEFKTAFEGRLHALGRAHDLLVAEDWSRADLDQLIRRTLEPYGLSERIMITGPRLHLTPQAGVAMAMVLNELATNAVKYGALSNQSGRLEVTWHLDGSASGQRVHLVWIETGGPPMTPPSRRGFGSSLIERSISHQLGGTATPEFRAEGLYYEIAFPWQENGLPPDSRRG